jgi:peptide/nickel transport system permease protein
MRSLSLFFSRWQNLFGLGIVILFIGIAVAAPYIAPLPDEWKSSALYVIPGLKSGLPVAPGDRALLGTIALGIQGKQIDVYYTLVWGTRSALIFGVIAAFFTALIGILAGSISAFFGGWANTIIMRITDAFLAFPVIAGVILFVQLINLMNEWTYNYASLDAIGEPGLLSQVFETINPALLAIIIFSWMPYARLTQGVVMRVKNAEFIHASRALGASPGRIIFRHLIPNSIAPAIVLATTQVGGMVLLQAALDFIGLDAGSIWGSVLAIGRRWMLGSFGNPFVYWWVFIPITVVLVLFGIGWSLLGDGINEWLNPRVNEAG